MTPTYDYRCGKCGHEYEAYQPITAKPLTRCPKCKGRVKRLIGTGGGLLFKGSGFYLTDYRSEGYKKSAKEDSKDSSKEGSKESAKGSESAGGASKSDGDAGAKTTLAPAEKKSDTKTKKSKDSKGSAKE